MLGSTILTFPGILRWLAGTKKYSSLILRSRRPSRSDIFDVFEILALVKIGHFRSTDVRLLCKRLGRLVEKAAFSTPCNFELGLRNDEIASCGGPPDFMISTSIDVAMTATIKQSDSHPKEYCNIMEEAELKFYPHVVEIVLALYGKAGTAARGYR